MWPCKLHVISQNDKTQLCNSGKSLYSRPLMYFSFSQVSLLFVFVLHNGSLTEDEWACCRQQAHSQGVQGVRCTPKSAKRSTLSTKWAKNGVFVGGLRGWGLKSPLFGSKRSTFGGPAPPQSTLATGLAGSCSIMFGCSRPSRFLPAMILLIFFFFLAIFLYFCFLFVCLFFFFFGLFLSNCHLI